MTENRHATIRYIVFCIVCLTVTGAVFTARASDGQHQHGDSSLGMAEFVQITIMQLDAGEQTFEAFRILPDDVVEWARWNSGGSLLDHAQPFKMNHGIFNKVLSLPSFANPPGPAPEDGALGRPAFRLDMASFTGARVKMISLPDMPEDMAQLISELRDMVQENTTPPRPGWYVWTQPYASVHNPDIDLSEDRCNSPACRAVLQAVKTGKMIVQADSCIQTFISGGRSHRSAFFAKVSLGSLLFGVLTGP
jgi:hypothetical protein